MMAARRQAVLVAGLIAVVSLLWLLLLPWDLSSVDQNGELIDGRGGDVFARWRAVALGVCWFVAVAASVTAGVRARTALAAVVAVGSFWFLWRTGSARVIGANMFVVGWLFAFLPAVSVGGLVAVLVGRALRPAAESHVAKGPGSPDGRE